MLIGSIISIAESARLGTLRARRVREDFDDGIESRGGIGELPIVALGMAVGLLLVAGADRLARGGVGLAEPLLWLGLIVLVAPALARLLSPAVTRTECIALVVLLGLGMYLVKVAANPYAFTYPDELAHAYNVDAILSTHHLFEPNPLILVTPLFPGLASVTAALSSMSGLSVFQAGLAVIAVARLVGMLALFLFLEQVGRSTRLAGIAASLYAANPNFAFYSAEFAYESLALPLALLVLFVTARRASTRDARERMAWTIAGVVTILAVVITHHVTSYALVAALAGVTAIVSFRNRRRVRVTAPWDLLIVAFVGSMAWLLTVASPTLVYLGSVFGPAIAQTVSALLAGRPIRGLFQATPGAVATPLWQQLVGLIWVVLLVVGIIWGLIQARGRTLSTTFAPVLLVAAAIYVPLQGLRLTQAGWETANRSSEFLFVGVALVLALAALTILTSRRYELRQRIAALTGCGVLLVLGAIITGWTYQLQLPPPYLVIASDGRSVEPEGVIDARWALQMLGPGNVIATDQSNALFMATYGRQLTYTGQERGVQGLFFAPTADASVLDVLRTAQPQYVVFDQRLRSWDHLVGVFPPGGAGPLGPPSPLLDPATLAKFDAMDGVSRIADSGNIVVFDMRQETDALSR